MSAKKPILFASRICGPTRTPLAADNTTVTGYLARVNPNFIVVFQVDEEVGTYTSTYTLMWRKGSNGFVDLAATGELNWAATTDLVQGTAVTTKLCTAAGASGSGWQNGEEVEGAATCDSIALVDEKYTEIHFAVNCANAIEGGAYTFQLWENTGGTAVNGAAAAGVTMASDQPSVVLNTDEAYAFGADTTPTLEFTGTDAGASPIRYNIQIDTVDTFDSQSVAPALIDNYAGSNDIGSLLYGGYYIKNGQTFTANGRSLGTVQFYLYKDLGSPTGTATAQLFATSAGVPTGSALATSGTFDVSTLTATTVGTAEEITFTFTGVEQYLTGPGAVYWIGVIYTGGDTSNRIAICCDNTSPSHAGVGYYYDSSWHSSPTMDRNFNLFDNGYGPLLDKLSGTDAGFAGTPDNTDPFASAQLVSYTVQVGEELVTGTYYQRVKGMDPPPGSGEYGAFAATKSFTVDTGGGSTELVPANTAHTLASTTPTLTQAHTLAVVAAAHTLASTSPVLVQHKTLAVANAAHTLASDTPTLTENKTLAVANSAHTLESTTPALTENKTLAVAAAAHTVASAAVTLTQDHHITVAASSHALSSDTPGLTENRTLGVADSAHALASDNITLGATSDTELVVAAAAHALTSDTPALTQNKTLAVASADHTLTSDNVTLVHGRTLAVQNGAHAVTSDTPNLIRHVTIVVQDGTSTVASDDPNLIQHFTLSVNNAASEVTSEEPTISVMHNLIVQSAMHGVTSDNVVVETISNLNIPNLPSIGTLPGNIGGRHTAFLH